MRQRRGSWVVPVGGGGVGGMSEACWEMGLGGNWCVAWEPPKRFLSCGGSK